MPKYFAGTLNQAAGYIIPYPAPDPWQQVWVVQAWLKLGTENLGFVTVDTYDYPPGEPIPMAVAVGCAFDSTHFPNGTPLRVRVGYKDNFDRVFEQDSPPVSVKNKALLGNHSFAVGAIGDLPGTQSHDDVEAALQGYYGIVKKLHNELALPGWKGELGGANFVYVTSHGTPDYYEMENGDGFTDAPESDPDSHKKVLMDTVGASFPGASYPPYNASTIPPPNFVFVDACNTYQSDFSWTLYPKANLYDGSGIPRATNIFGAGWNIKLRANDSSIIAEKIMLYLRFGWPARRGIEKAIVDLAALGITDTLGMTISMTMLEWDGDPYTKVIGIYTGDDIPTLNWFRS